jgi:hypothetical protein
MEFSATTEALVSRGFKVYAFKKGPYVV